MQILQSGHEFRLLRCPHCQKLVERTVSCKVCYEPMRNLDGIDVGTLSGPLFHHVKCYNEVLKDISCPFCSKPFTPQFIKLWKGGSDDNCGSITFVLAAKLGRQ